MKRVITVLVLLLVILNLQAQTENDLSSAEKMPMYPGGDAALISFLSRKIKYPPEALEIGVNGIVVIQFTIFKDGSIDSFNIIRSLPYGCDEEVIRVLKLMPKWEPGYKDHEPVNVNFTLPVTFYIEGKGSSPVLPILFNKKLRWEKFLSQNLKHPKSDKSKKISGDVVVSFFVNENKLVSDIKIIKSLGTDFDNEAIRVIELSKNYWQPATNNWKPYKSEKIITIHF